jgi:hypothetical protein
MTELARFAIAPLHSMTRRLADVTSASCIRSNLALEGARSLGLSLPSMAVAQQLFSACTAHGGKDWDHSAMVRALELMAGQEIAAA